MKLVTMQADVFDKLASIEPGHSFYQSSKWGQYAILNNKEPVYLGLVNENGIYMAMGLFILNKKELFKKNEAYCPFGFLINYYDNDLLKEFMNAVKIFLHKKGVGKLTINPKIEYMVRSHNNDLLIKKIEEIGFKKISDNFIFYTEIEQIPKKPTQKDLIFNTYTITNQEEISRLSDKKEELNDLFKAFDKQVIINICEADFKTSIDKLTSYIEDTKKYIEENKEDNSKTTILEKNETTLLEKEKTRDDLIELYKQNNNKNLVLLSILINSNSEITLLAIDNTEKYKAYELDVALYSQTLKSINKLGYNSFYGFQNLSNSKKTEYIGKFVCQI